jgi:hypothetical protein
MCHAHVVAISRQNLMEIDMLYNGLDSVAKLVAQNVGQSGIRDGFETDVGDESMDSPLARFNRPLNMIAYEDQK